MSKVILAGCHGRMGQQFAASCVESDILIVAGIDHLSRPSNLFPVFPEPDSYIPDGDVLVDFSHTKALAPLLEFCKARCMSAVLGVTGYSKEQAATIAAAAKSIPIFQAPNLSIGASILSLLAEYASALLGPDFDAVIIERHHKGKLDAPSGTALALSGKLKSSAEILSARAGTTAGEHTVMFAGNGEVLELFHRADTRDVYAAGAIHAVRFMAQISTPGLYGMQHLLQSRNISPHEPNYPR